MEQITIWRQIGRVIFILAIILVWWALFHWKPKQTKTAAKKKCT